MRRFKHDLDPQDAQYNYQKGLGDMIAGDVFKWLMPAILVKTHDSSYNSILDFVFLANANGRISGTSEIIVVPRDFPNDGTTPDHRPVKAVLSIADPSSLKGQILDRIAKLEQELAALKALLGSCKCAVSKHLTFESRPLCVNLIICSECFLLAKIP
jgi:hypothetical protein